MIEAARSAPGNACGISRFVTHMRHLVLPATLSLLFLAGCSGGNGGGNNAAAAQPPQPKPTGPAPKTPQIRLPRQPDNAGDWMEPSNAAGDPQTTPYANLLEQPVVNAAAH